MAVRRIFISYRREDSQDVAGRIYDRLVARYGEEHVFKDVDDIPLGADFPQHIDGAVSSCAVCLVIIGPQWCTVQDAEGRRRLDAEDDFVRLEVEAALARDIPAVPVLVGGASMPRRADLPPSLHGLVRRQAIPVRPDPDFHTDVDRLIRGLDRLPDAELQPVDPASAEPPKSRAAADAPSSSPGPLAWLTPWRWGALPWRVWHVVAVAACGLALVAAMAAAHRSFARVDRTGVEPPAELEGRARWRFQAEADLNSGPCVAPDGALYVGAMDGQCYALSAEGKLLWTYRTGDGVNFAPAVGPDGGVYVASWDGCLYALDKQGGFRWKFATRGPIDSTPRFGAGGAVYLTSRDRSVYAVSEGGKQLWEFPTGNHVSSSTALGPDGTVYAGSWDGHVYAISPQGKLKWKFRTGGKIEAGVVVGPNGHLYCAPVGAKALALDAEGQVVWQCALGSDSVALPVVGKDGTAFLGLEDGRLCALDAGGRLAWTVDLGSAVTSVALSPNDDVYVGTADAVLRAFSAEGAEQWRLQAPSVVRDCVVAPDDALYLACKDRCLYALPPRAPAGWRYKE
jgi:outer membrane protein assembly factor BamB